MIHKVYIGLGTNLEDRQANIQHAIEALKPKVSLCRASSIYETAPWGFTNQPNFTPFQSVEVPVNLDDLNIAYTPSAKLSEGLVFDEADSNDDNLFNEILWKGIKGETAQLPAPRRSAFVRVVASDKD